jgi:hypothetical protein
MVVTMMLEDVSQSDHLDSEPLLSLQILNDTGGDAGQLSVTVKNLTTTGVILASQHQGTSAKTEMLKGREGLLRVKIAPGNQLAEIPGKIMWTRNHEDNAAVTLGMEILEPLSSPQRHALEASMPSGAKDMKVLWDHWDEIQEKKNTADVFEPESVLPLTDPPEVFQEKEESSGRGNWLYWIGFGIIISGLAMQFPQSEYLGFSGIVMMFCGSLLIAWKSIMSMRQLSPAGPAERS